MPAVVTAHYRAGPSLQDHGQCLETNADPTSRTSFPVSSRKSVTMTISVTRRVALTPLQSGGTSRILLRERHKTNSLGQEPEIGSGCAGAREGLRKGSAWGFLLD